MNQVFNTDILKGKVAFVTGGGTGITGGVARAFAEHGARLAITSRKEENLAAMKEAVEAGGGECLTIPGDVRDFDAVEADYLASPGRANLSQGIPLWFSAAHIAKVDVIK